MARQLTSLNPVEEAADDIFHLLKLSEHNTLFVDRDGDLDVVVGIGEESRTFRVCKAAMRLTSPVWRAMLSTEYNFMEATKTTHEITFPEDDVASFFTVLLAGHVRFLEIPKCVDEKILRNLCVLCDKYDCITVLRPWLAVWMAPLLENLRNRKFPSDWAMIAWVTGRENLFKSATNELVISCNLDETQKCLMHSGTSLEGGLPYGLNDRILEYRNATLTRIIDACHSMVEKYSFTSNDTICKAKWGQEDCDIFVLGHLVRQLQKLQIWPGKPDEIINRLNGKTISNVHAEIKAMHDFMRPDTGKQRFLSSSVSLVHIGCGCTSTLVDLSKAAMDESRMSSIPEPERRHLQVQLQKVMVSKIEMGKFQRPGASKVL